MNKNDKILYFDCGSGISGDMALGALIHLGAPPDQIKCALETAGLPSFRLAPRPMEKNGVKGIDLDVIIYDAPQHDHDYDGCPNQKATVCLQDDGHAICTAARIHDYDDLMDDLLPSKNQHCHGHPSESMDGEHAHRTYKEIKQLIESSGLTPGAKRLSLNIYECLARSEAQVHSTSIEDVAFHEVGRIDALINILGSAVAVDILKPGKIFCSPVHDGQGFVKCSHGLIPVPVPAVMEMAKAGDIPLIIDADAHMEMVTPTGFAILLGLGAVYMPQLMIKPERVGYGFGKRQTVRFGAVRAVLGT
jgi:uncharacterized protein (DUF111 family)